MGPKLGHWSPFTFGIAVVLGTVMPSGTSAQEIGSLSAERSRLREITGDTALAPRAAVRALRLPGSILGTTLIPIPPTARLVWNSAIPYSLNDGSLWAGRGLNASISGGFTTERSVRSSVVRLAVAPRFFFSQNQPFQVLPGRIAGRSGWSSPFHAPPVSLDIPLRFGDREIEGFDLGNSALTLSRSHAEFGVTSADAWWGPGIRNALVMSNNAPGIPRVFARGNVSGARWGKLEGELFSGSLTKSRFFSEGEVDFRSLSGLRLQWTPGFDSTLTVGFARVVYAPISTGDSQTLTTLSRSFDALLRWDNNISQTQSTDQIGALFARWIFPEAGFEVYGEWARMDPPRNATELLVAPHYSGAWSFGFQWAQQKRSHSYLRLQSELSYLEQSTVYTDRPTVDFYSGRGSPHGYTQRGQVIGASIGPGASSQFIGLDWITPRWQAGIFVGRVRWDNDALYREPGATFLHHDVSLLSGLRGAWRSRFSDFSLELTTAGRYNYLFQNSFVAPPGGGTVDVSNLTLVLVATPR